MEIRLNIYFNVALLEKFGLDPLDIHTNTHTPKHAKITYFETPLT